MSEEPTTYEKYRAARAALSPTQLARVMLKQQWERCSALSVYANWPSLFDPDREQDEDELKACRELIAERPDLFPMTPVPEIERFDPEYEERRRGSDFALGNDPIVMEPCEDGEYVRYIDHTRITSDLQDRVEKAERALRELQNGPDTLTQNGLRIVNRALYGAPDQSSDQATAAVEERVRGELEDEARHAEAAASAHRSHCEETESEYQAGAAAALRRAAKAISSDTDREES